jgi:hypothetical protein
MRKPVEIEFYLYHRILKRLFSFFLGTKIGSLQVSLLKNGNSSSPLTIFTRNGTQANRWFKRQLRIDVDDINYDFAMTIDANLKAEYGYGKFSY